MILPKIDRARIILGCVQAMLRKTGTVDGPKYKAGDMQTCSVNGVWTATVTRATDASEEPAPDLPRDQWDMLHLHADGELKLALRFHGYRAEIIVYVPGFWERWFAIFDLSDTEIIHPAKAA